MSAFTWTSEISARAVEMKLAGSSASEIARELGVTRNAVIGRLHRIHVPQPAKRPPAEKRPRAAKVPSPAPKAPAFVPETPQYRLVTIMELTAWHCRWPVGDPLTPQFRYCGAVKPPEPSQPYCECHRRMSVGTGTQGERGAITAAKAVSYQVVA